MTAWQIPLSDLDLGSEERNAVVGVIESGWLTLGAEVSAFEREFAAFSGARQSVLLSSGTAALHLACMALGVGPDIEVIVPSLSFVASANSVALAGGRPVFADAIGPDDFTMDPVDVERRITSATRGVMCMHYGGFACDMDELVEICRRHDLFLIEDVAHAPGVEWKGHSLGTLGDAGCFSFFGNKNMTTGEGGVALARDPEVLERIRLMRSHGMTSMSWDRYTGHAWAYDVVSLGYNYRPSELTAALGRAQLVKLPSHNARRYELLERYRSHLAEVPRIEMPFAGRSGAAHLAVAVVERPDLREPLRRALAEAGIQTSVHYPPAHLFRHYRETYDYAPGDLPITEDLAGRAITLPLYATLAAEQVDQVCGSIAAFMSRTPAVP